MSPHLKDNLIAWYADPDRSKKRRKALNAISHRLTQVLEPAGFQRDGLSWAKSRMKVEVQKSSRGEKCFLNLLGNGPGLLRANRVVRIGEFYLSDEDDHVELGILYYFQVLEQPKRLETAVEILKSRGLPWLQACQNSLRGPEPQQFLPAAG